MLNWIVKKAGKWFRSDRTAHQKRINMFMRKCKQELPDKPGIPAESVRSLRARLVMEEALELIEAMGVTAYVTVGYTPEPEDREPSELTKNQAYISLRFNRLKFEPVSGRKWISLAEVAKEAADLSVVTVGTMSAFGIKDKAVLEAVDRNNLEKFGPGSYVDDNGKLIKPPGHKKPDLIPILFE